MKTRKVLISIVAVVLICAMSIAGTLAVLKSTTDNEVVNTFVAAGNGSLFTDAAGAIVLNESEAVLDATTGKYTLKTESKVYANSYSVLPGTVVAKDPAISVTGKNEVPAYVYVEVVDATGENITWEIADAWTKADELTGVHGGEVYYLAAPIVDDLAATPVLKDNQITVLDADNLALEEGKTMTFYGYIAQSVVNGVTDPIEVFEVSFK